VGALSVVSRPGAAYTNGKPRECALMTDIRSESPRSSAPEATAAAIAPPLVEILDVDVQAGLLEEAHVDTVKEFAGHFRGQRTDMNRQRRLDGRLRTRDRRANQQQGGDAAMSRNTIWRRTVTPMSGPANAPR